MRSLIIRGSKSFIEYYLKGFDKEIRSFEFETLTIEERQLNYGSNICTASTESSTEPTTKSESSTESAAKSSSASTDATESSNASADTSSANATTSDECPYWATPLYLDCFFCVRKSECTASGNRYRKSE